MTEVLCFGDSNTWGYNPKDGSRFSWEIRWTGRLQKELQGDGIRVLEEGLCGRTTIFEDPLRQGRRGTELFPGAARDARTAGVHHTDAGDE